MSIDYSLITLLIIAFAVSVNTTPGLIISSQDVLNNNGEALFQVYDEHLLKVNNLHRVVPSEQFQVPPAFKMTLIGVAVERIEQNSSSSTYELKLENADRVQIRVIEKQNVSEFEFHWKGAVRKREVCFHYAYNRASW